MGSRLRLIGLCTAATLLPFVSAAPVSGAAAPKGSVAAKVVKVVDGDTVDVTLGGKRVRVNLLGVDTPERGRCWFKAATARTAALLPVGRTAYLLADKAGKDRSGTRVFYVWNVQGVHVNRNLVRYGYGKAAPVKPDDRYLAVLRTEQTRAKADKLRIWSGHCDGTGSTPTPTKTPAPAPTPTRSDPPTSGNDPRFRTCAEANAAGYGPYRRGVDPEYGWYQDRDGDGLVCER
ncbi:excalibur calcium-binding domain-containing protein [Nonomuraea sp. NBC_01738]|uniref:thermonuclease family protein n=1 Tax=Nonomuraea sp. NBC_01738 TaxID=2976003 RepID=UPI002E110F9F|nr:excalibur calcium-binding domain-containing protein [Nonomuraea sp. NBC_01738]